MYKNNIAFLITLIFLITSCGDTWSDVKGGLTGQKRKSTDEFLVQKKDPLILPPDFENLPTPDYREEAKQEISSFEKTLTKTSGTEEVTSTAGSAEQSILKKIPKNTTSQKVSEGGSAEESILKRIRKK